MYMEVSSQLYVPASLSQMKDLTHTHLDGADLNVVEKIKILSLPGFETPGRPARSQSFYRLLKLSR
jgi:hypothetical protein